jgi:hypothetical protein
MRSPTHPSVGWKKTERFICADVRSAKEFEHQNLAAISVLIKRFSKVLFFLPRTPVPFRDSGKLV